MSESCLKEMVRDELIDPKVCPIECGVLSPGGLRCPVFAQASSLPDENAPRAFVGKQVTLKTAQACVKLLGINPAG